MVSSALTNGLRAGGVHGQREGPSAAVRTYLDLCLSELVSSLGAEGEKSALPVYAVRGRPHGTSGSGCGWMTCSCLCCVAVESSVRCPVLNTVAHWMIHAEPA
jgi:hypothetical protein